MKNKLRLGSAFCLILLLVSASNFHVATTAVIQLASRMLPCAASAVGALGALYHRAYYPRSSSLIAQQLSRSLTEQHTILAPLNTANQERLQTVPAPAHPVTIDSASADSASVIQDKALRIAGERFAAGAIAHVFSTTKLPTYNVHPKMYARENLIAHSYPIDGGRIFTTADRSAYCSIAVRERPIRACDIEEYQCDRIREARHQIAYHNVHTPGFTEQFEQEISCIAETLFALNHPNLITRVSARLSLLHLHSCIPYLDEAIQHSVAQLCPLFFDKNGALVNDDHCDKSITITKQTIEHLCHCLHRAVPDFSSIAGMRESACKNRFLAGARNVMRNAIQSMMRKVTPEQCRNNPHNSDIIALLTACENGDFVTASRYAQTDLTRALFKNFISDSCAQFAPDSLAVINETQLQEFLGGPEKILEYQGKLAVRKHIAQEVCSAWCIDSVRNNLKQNNALYEFAQELINSDGSALSMITIINKIDAQYHDQSVINLFYLPNGIMRDFKHYHMASRANLPTITRPEYRSARRALNYCAYIHEHASEAMRVELEKIINELFVAENIRKNAALFSEICNTEYHEKSIENECKRIIDNVYNAAAKEEANDPEKSDGTEKTSPQTEDKSPCVAGPILIPPSQDPKKDDEEGEDEKKDKDNKEDKTAADSKQTKEPSKDQSQSFTEEMIEEEIKRVMKDKNKVDHIFKPKHKLQQLVDKLGDAENVIREVLKALGKNTRSDGVFEDLMLRVGDCEVYLRGNIINGAPKIGTFFIK